MSTYLILINQTICPLSISFKALLPKHCQCFAWPRKKKLAHWSIKPQDRIQPSKPCRLQGHSTLQKCISRDAFPSHKHSRFELSWFKFVGRVYTNVGCAKMQDFGNFFFKSWSLSTQIVPVKLMGFLMLMTGLCVSLNQYAHDSFLNVTHCEKLMYQLKKKRLIMKSIGACRKAKSSVNIFRNIK